jgi:hypothetical protein
LSAFRGAGVLDIQTADPQFPPMSRRAFPVSGAGWLSGRIANGLSAGSVDLQSLFAAVSMVYKK